MKHLLEIDHLQDYKDQEDFFFFDQCKNEIWKSDSSHAVLFDAISNNLNL